METECKNDHDSVVTLVAVVKNLKEGQDKFHLEMKDAFKDLKDNFASRLDNLELRTGRLETSKTKQTVLLSIGIAMIGVLVSLIIYHIVK